MKAMSSSISCLIHATKGLAIYHVTYATVDTFYCVDSAFDRGLYCTVPAGLAQPGQTQLSGHLCNYFRDLIGFVGFISSEFSTAATAPLLPSPPYGLAMLL